MSIRPLVALSLLCAACEAEVTPSGPTPELCPLTRPSRLAPAPPGWRYQPGRNSMFFQVHGDRLLYAFINEQFQGELWGVTPCDGEPERLISGRLAYSWLRVADTPDGLVLYGADPQGVIRLIDRLDVSGEDEPTAVAGLPPMPEIDRSSSSSGTRLPGTFHSQLEGAGSAPNDAAGVGAAREKLWFHPDDPAYPVRLLGDAIVATRVVDGDVLVHDDDGQVRRFDLETGASEPLLVGVRYVRPVTRRGGSTALIWQAIGDDQAEPVFVRDLESGEDLDLAINDFAAASWNRDAYRSNAGAWIATSDDAGAVIALRGPGGPLARAHDLDTLAEFAVPPHVRTLAVGGEGVHFGLVLAEGAEHVYALWEPRTGAVREWYRGPPLELWLGPTRVGDRVEYRVENPDSSLRLLSVDLATGATTTVLPRLSYSTQTLPDGRLLTRFGRQSLSEVVLIDRDTGVHKTLVAGVPTWTYMQDFGVIYLDAASSGLYALPIPPR